MPFRDIICGSISSRSAASSALAALFFTSLGFLANAFGNEKRGITPEVRLLNAIRLNFSFILSLGMCWAFGYWAMGINQIPLLACILGLTILMVIYTAVSLSVIAEPMVKFEIPGTPGEAADGR